MLKKISTVFNANIGTLRIFHQQMGSIAEDHDNDYAASVLQNATEIIGDEFAGPLHTVMTTPPDDIPEEIKQTFQEFAAATEEEKIEAAENFGRQEPENYRKMNKLLQEIRQPQAHAKLVRRGSLMILTSLWDYLISELVHKHYSLYPKALSSKKTLTLTDLYNFESIEDAKERFVSDEADFVVRKNLQEQLKYFSKNLNVDLRILKEYEDALEEIFQRRNLFVHNSGFVNRRYLSNISDASKEKYKPRLKELLPVTREYISEAIDTLQIAGFILLQLCWRQWKKENLNTADTDLINLSKSALDYQQFPLIKSLFRFATQVSPISGETIKLVTINYAIALRDNHKYEEMEKILSKHKWEQSAIKVQVAFYTLIEDYEKVYKLLPLIIKKEGQIYALEAIDWPLFRPIKDDPQFLKILSAAN